MARCYHAGGTDTCSNPTSCTYALGFWTARADIAEDAHARTLAELTDALKKPKLSRRGLEAVLKRAQERALAPVPGDVLEGGIPRLESLTRHLAQKTG
jgi:hypothetical protein